MYLLILENSADTHQCETCGPTYSSEQLALASQFFIRRDMGLPLEVRYADVADPRHAAAYSSLVREAQRAGWTFPVVLLMEEGGYRLLLEGSAEPFAILEALKEHLNFNPSTQPQR